MGHLPRVSTPPQKRTGWGGARPGAGPKPKPDPKLKTSVQLTPAQHQKVKALAQQQNVKLTVIIRQAVDALPEPQETPHE